MDLVIQKIKNESEGAVEVGRRSVSPRLQHSPIDSSSSGGCSRRAILKQRKFCHQCKRRPASIVESPADSSGPLRFCSSSCLDTYKLEIFTRETLLCLQNGPSSSSSSHSTVGSLSTSPTGRMMSSGGGGGGGGSKHRGGRSGERVVASPTKTRKRGHHPRPHPSYRLNKRYWDDLRAGRIVEGNGALVEVAKKRKSEENQAAGGAAVSTSTAPVIQIAASAPSSSFVPISASRPATDPRPLQPSPAATTVAPVPTLSLSLPLSIPPLHQEQPQQPQQSKKVSSLFGDLIIIPIPIPIPFPLPIPLTEKFVIDKYGHL